MSVDWSNKDIQEWLETCRERQDEYYTLLGRYKWIQYKPTEHDLLKRNIGFAMFGCPSESTGYNDKQRELIDKMFTLIEGTKKEHQDKHNICVSFIYVCCKIGDNHMEFPVIRVPKYDVTSITNSDMFIDSSFRVYQDWQDFLDNNKFPNCLMSYPKRGRYFKLSNQLQLDQQISPAGKISTKVLKGFDITTTVVNCATVGVGVASLFVPVAWPVLLGVAGVSMATGGYNAGRNIAQLRDRGVHQQSIGLDNAESRNCYLGIVGSALGVASGGAVAAAAGVAQVSESIAKASHVAMRSISATSFAVNSLGVVHGIANIIQKSKEGEEVTGLDIFQITSSVLFFANSVISCDQVDLLIKIVTKGDTSILSEISNLANENVRSVTGIGKIIHIENESSIVRLVCKYVCRNLYEITKLFQQKKICPEDYTKQRDSYLEMIWDSWNEEINTVIDIICNFFEKQHLPPVVIEKCTYFTGENPNFMNIFAKEVITSMSKFHNYLATLQKKDSGMDVEVAAKYRDLVLEISKRFADELQCEHPGDFIRYFKFTYNFIMDQFIKIKEAYDKCLQVTREFSPSVTVEEFDKEYGIQTNHYQYFLRQVTNDFKDGKAFFNMIYAYYDKQETSSITEEADETCFPLTDKVIAIKNEEGLAPDGWLNRDQYLQIAEKLTKKEANVVLQEDAGTMVMIVQEAEKIIFVKTKKEDGKIFGIGLMLDHCPWVDTFTNISVLDGN